jgi:signal peptidase I
MSVNDLTRVINELNFELNELIKSYIEKVENYDDNKIIRIYPHNDIYNIKNLYDTKYDKIVFETGGFNLTYKNIYILTITQNFRNFCIDEKLNPQLLIQIRNKLEQKNNLSNNDIRDITTIYLVNSSEFATTTGGKKVVIKYTVKQLQAIASKNNIKITKKVDGKTVRLNKQGLMSRLKRYKLI